jgi:hypothetical protein
MRVIACLAEGLGIRGTARVFEIGGCFRGVGLLFSRGV